MAIADDVDAERWIQDREEDDDRSGGGLAIEGSRDMLVLADEEAIDAATDGRRDILRGDGR